MHAIIFKQGHKEWARNIISRPTGWVKPGNFTQKSVQILTTLHPRYDLSIYDSSMIGTLQTQIHCM